MTIKELNIDDLREYENNPRINDNAVDAVASSIKYFGFKVPIIIDKDNVIIAGHTRHKAARKLGLQTVPCIVADDLTPEQIKAFRVADNKTAELAEWDFNALAAELEEIKNIDLTQFGFDIDEINPNEFDEDFSLPDDDKPVTRTITLSLSEKQFEIVTACSDYIVENELIEHTFGNHNEQSNAIFEVIYEWAQQKNLL